VLTLSSLGSCFGFSRYVAFAISRKVKTSYNLEEEVFHGTTLLSFKFSRFFFSLKQTVESKTTRSLASDEITSVPSDS